MIVCVFVKYDWQSTTKLRHTNSKMRQAAIHASGNAGAVFLFVSSFQKIWLALRNLWP